jgi:hypothetical protein
MNKIKKLQRIFKFIEQYKFKAIRNTNRIKFFKNKLNFLGRKKIHNYIESLYKQLYKKNRFLKKINKKLNKKIFYYYVNKPIYNMISNNRINKMNLKNPYLKNKLYILFLYIINLIKSIKTNNKLMINTFKLLG